MAKRRKRKPRRFTGTPEAELRAALNRLDESTTKLQRKNARSHLWSVLQWIKATAKRNFPLLDKDNKPVKKRRTATCPKCNTTFKTFKAMAIHCYGKHGMRSGSFMSAVPKCWCGKIFDDSFEETYEYRWEQRIASFGLHLAKAGDLKRHMKSSIAKLILEDF
jgi:hypothetical protein